MLLQFLVTAMSGPWKSLLHNYLEFLYEGERKRGKMRHLESFSDHEFIHLINCGYVIYKGVSRLQY
jgi:hypothetical protein